uniref:Proteasome subunit beta n=1 Tax=Plectus sambesii TaxID=2011161 RepID=A0A914WW96_9BILA
MAAHQVAHRIAEENQRTLNPTCTGTSVVAVTFDGGVAIVADRVASYGKTARYKGVSRLYRLNSSTLIGFGGDHADFQFIQNLIYRRAHDYKAMCGDPDAELSPMAVHSYLTALLYYRRSRMNPLWNTLVVVGTQPDDEGVKKPFIGIVTLKGVAYHPKYVATGLGAMLIQQSLETEFRKHQATYGAETKLTKDEAVGLLRKAMELVYYHDCLAHSEYEIGVVTTEDAAVLPPEELVGNWAMAETNCNYE